MFTTTHKHGRILWVDTFFLLVFEIFYFYEVMESLSGATKGGPSPFRIMKEIKKTAYNGPSPIRVVIEKTLKMQNQNNGKYCALSDMILLLETA